MTQSIGLVMKMNEIKSGGDASAFLLRCVWCLLAIPLALVLCFLIVYKSGVLHWQEVTISSQLEMALLSVCFLLLGALLVVGNRRLVQVQEAERRVRTSFMQSEARLKSLLNTIPDLIWLKDVEGVYLACNPAFERFFGHKETEIVGKTDFDFVDEELALFFRENDRAALLAGVARTNEEWITFAEDGKRALLETIKIPVKTREGETVGVLGISRDITRRHEAEREALLFRNLVEFSGDPVYVLDRSNGYRMAFANQAACKHFGVARDEILSWSVFDWDPDVTQSDLDNIKEKMMGGHSAVFETRHRVASGAIEPVEVSANHFIHEGRDLSAGYIRNITERKRAEENLRQSREQLRQLMAHQDRIREDERKRIAREIHDELGQHLLALRIDVSLLPQTENGDSGINGRVQEILKNIDSTVKSVRAIINNLRPSVLDLGFFAAIEWLLRDFERRSGISCELIGNEDELHLDESQATTLFRVLQEALTNVLRHAEATRVTVKLHRIGNALIMKIADNGVGLSVRNGGSGEAFGLLGIRERVAILGGEAKVESGNGTLLTVTLPLGFDEMLATSEK